MAAAAGVSCVGDAAIGRRTDWELDNLRQMASRSGVEAGSLWPERPQAEGTSRRDGL